MTASYFTNIKWVSPNEKSPEKGKEVLILRRYPRVFTHADESQFGFVVMQANYRDHNYYSQINFVDAQVHNKSDGCRLGDPDYSGFFDTIEVNIPRCQVVGWAELGCCYETFLKKCYLFEGEVRRHEIEMALFRKKENKCDTCGHFKEFREIDEDWEDYPPVQDEWEKKLKEEE
jgi:hypothetical protein